MKEENNGASKNKWRRILQKKWFFPAMYLIIAAFLLTVVVWYQNLDNQVSDVQERQETSDPYNPSLHGEDVESVLDQQEVVKMPLTENEQAEIVTKFYDHNADEEDQENGLVLYNNRYYQSKGIDITTEEDEAFDVVAALSGEVTEVKEDPLLGNVVILTHENDVMTYYASLGDVGVEVGTKVKQGEEIGTAGKNLFGKDNGTHVHFQLRKDEVEVNPETYFNQPLSKLDEIVEEDAVDSLGDEEESEDQSEDEAEDSEKEEMDEQEEEMDEQEEVEESEENEENESDETEDDPLKDLMEE